MIFVLKKLFLFFKKRIDKHVKLWYTILVSCWKAAQSDTMEGFPSGQRGQTVNLLSSTSMVRIHLPPPFSLRGAKPFWRAFCFYIGMAGYSAAW